MSIFLEFNLRFFFVAMILTVALTIINPTIWLLSFGPSYYQFSIFILQPLQLVLSVFLPFTIMYIMTLKTQQQARLRPILLATFFGCWLGGLINAAIQIFATLQFSSSWSYINPVVMVYELFWLIVQGAFLEILFVCMAAIMLAYYRAH